MSLPELSFADVVQPAWNASPRMRALVTTRDGGVSEPPFGRWQNGADAPGGLNLGMKSGDDLAAVATNRARLLALAGVKDAAWLEQIHGADIVRAEDVLTQAHATGAPTRADASVTDRPGTVCVVIVADCMPVLFCDEAGRAVGAAHAGWRGLAADIVKRRQSAWPSLRTSSRRSYMPISGRRLAPTHSKSEQTFVTLS